MSKARQALQANKRLARENQTKNETNDTAPTVLDSALQKGKPEYIKRISLTVTEEQHEKLRELQYRCNTQIMTILREFIDGIDIDDYVKTHKK